MEEYKERPVWRNVLSICILLFVLIRWGVYCSKTDDTKHETPQNELDLISNIAVRNNLNHTQNSYNKPVNKNYNDIIYFNYNYLDTINQSQKLDYMIIKISKDSLLNLDLYTKFKVLKNSYLQNTYDKELKYAIKTPQNLCIFIHSIESEKTLDESFKGLKKDDHLSNFKDFIKMEKSAKIVSYSIKKHKSIYQGTAFLAGNKEYKLFIEFESNKLSKVELEHKALSYIVNNIISKK